MLQLLELFKEQRQDWLPFPLPGLEREGVCGEMKQTFVCMKPKGGIRAAYNHASSSSQRLSAMEGLERHVRHDLQDLAVDPLVEPGPSRRAEG